MRGISSILRSFVLLLLQENSHSHHIHRASTPFACIQTHRNGLAVHNCVSISISRWVSMLSIMLKLHKRKNSPNCNCVSVNYSIKWIKSPKNKTTNEYDFIDTFFKIWLFLFWRNSQSNWCIFCSRFSIAKNVSVKPAKVQTSECCGGHWPK